MTTRQTPVKDAGAASPGIAVALVAVALMLLPGTGRAGDPKEVTVRGQVTEASGGGVAGHTVRLLKSRTITEFGSFDKETQVVEETRVTTDEHGFYEMTFRVDSQFRHYHLRFYDPDGFDGVKYRLPRDKNISRRARKGRPSHADIELELQQDWPHVEALIEQYGSASHAGRVLRSLGLPTRRESAGEGRELWVYEQAGVTYVLEGSKILETRLAENTGSTESAAEHESTETSIAVPSIEEEDLEDQ